VSDYKTELKKLQAEAAADLQRILNQSPPDPLRAERKMFLLSLIEARLRKHWSQAKLAKRLNMQQSAISRIESGKGNPGLNTLLAIAKALDVHLVIEY